MLWMVTDDTVTPMAITDDPAASELFNVFRYDRRFCSTGHYPTQLVDGLREPCLSWCVESHSQCLKAWGSHLLIHSNHRAVTNTTNNNRFQHDFLQAKKIIRHFCRFVVLHLGLALSWQIAHNDIVFNTSHYTCHHVADDARRRPFHPRWWRTTFASDRQTSCRRWQSRHHLGSWNHPYW